MSSSTSEGPCDQCIQSAAIQNDCTIFQLPPEIRNIIYGFVLLANEPIQLPCTRPALLQTCHQIQCDAKGLYYGINQFQATLTPFSVVQLSDYLDSIPTKYLACISHFTLACGMPDDLEARMHQLITTLNNLSVAQDVASRARKVTLQHVESTINSQVPFLYNLILKNLVSQKAVKLVRGSALPYQSYDALDAALSTPGSIAHGATPMEQYRCVFELHWKELMEGTLAEARKVLERRIL